MAAPVLGAKEKVTELEVIETKAVEVSGATKVVIWTDWDAR